ncbi:MAG: hypothetical protein AAF481_00715 [Acidobacteriota bacterium]
MKKDPFVRWISLAWVAAVAVAGPLMGQSLNIDFGEVGNAPADTYAAAGLPGVWNSFRADHATTTQGLVDLDGLVTSVSLRQFGGLDTPTVVDPATSGDDSLLLDDYLVTFDADLESCIFFTGLAPGEYVILIYARMPKEPAVLSYTSVDQEDGFPHYSIGGVWSGGHEELITFSRHRAQVGIDGRLDLHSGVVPDADPSLGAALNGLQVMTAEIFEDGFESGDLSRWGGTG